MKRYSTLLFPLIGLAAFTGSILANPAASDENQRRGDLTYQIVKKWGGHVQETYSIPARSWAMEMVPLFRASSLDTMQLAAQAKTFDGMNDALLKTQASNTGRPTANTKVLGALGNDLVYTPLTPCRILDTRSTAAGTIAANSTRSFVGINASNFTSQGGSATNCGTLGLSATALAVNFTAIDPISVPGTGFLTVYAFGTAQPNAATMVYKNNITLSNSAIVPIPNPLSSFDFTVYTSHQTHVAADIVGYFAPPLATALQCLETANTDLGITANGGTGNAVAPACPTGYTQTTTNCETTSWLMPIVYFQSGTCSARNGDTISQTLRASRTCCRVPGR